jgi:hypothetical protein
LADDLSLFPYCYADASKKVLGRRLKALKLWRLSEKKKSVISVPHATFKDYVKKGE